MRLRTKLTLAFVLISAILLGSVGILSNVLFDRVFQRYVIQARQQNSMDILHRLGERYDPALPGWAYETLDSIGVSAMGSNLIITVHGADGAELWNAWKHNNGMCTSILESVAQNMNSRYPNFKGEYMEDHYKITVRGKAVGSLAVGYYGPFSYTDNDIAFLRAFNAALAWVAAAAFAISLAVGLIISLGISKPIAGAVRAVGKIAGGDLTQRLHMKSKTAELRMLSHSINHLAETLDTLENLRRRMTSDVAHELRTPLFTLQSHVEAMLDGVWALNRERLQVCHDEILRLSGLVNDLQQLSQLETERLSQLDMWPFNYNDLAREVISQFEAEAMKKGVSISLEASSEIFVTADRQKMRQVLLNLLSNAVKYTDHGGHVQVEITREAESVVLRVRDTGIGIPQTDLPFVFERFYRTDQSRSRATGGVGIGLTIAKAFVEAHGGTIAAESGQGGGAVFTVRLEQN